MRILCVKEGTMEKFTLGLLTGMVGGALLVANNKKMQSLVKKGQEEVEEKLDETLEKIDESVDAKKTKKKKKTEKQ